MTRPPAPALSPVEAARVAAFDAAPYPREVVVARVERLADELQWLVDDETARVAHAWTLHRLRAALTSPAPAPQGEEGR